MMAILHSRYAGLFVIALAAVVIFVLSPNRFYLDILILAGINAVACIGLNLLIGYAGQISLGHAAFFSFGAYGPALLARLGVPALAGVLLSAALSAAFAYGIGRPIFRLKGHYLAMATLGLGIVISIVINTETGITGGADGLDVGPLRFGAYALTGEKIWFWIVTGALIFAALVALNLVDSPIGRTMRAVHGSEFAARAAGIDTQAVKIVVLVLSAVFASIAGSLFAYYVGFVTPAKAGFMKSIELVTMVVLGGLASVYGAIAGAVLLTILPQTLTFLEDYELAVFGGILVLSMMFMPRGLVPSLQAVLRR